MTTFGTVDSVERGILGSALLADAALGVVVLPVEFVGDFNEDGGQLLLNGNLLDYTSVDGDVDTVTLAAPLPVAASADDPVQVVEAGEPAVEWVANVVVDEGDTIAAVIPTALIGYFPEGSYDQPVGVELELVGDSYEVRSQPVRDPSLDGGTVWNPHAFRDVLDATIPDSTYTQVTLWATGEADGIIADTGYTVVYPGAYFISVQVAFASNAAGARRVRIMCNGAQIAYNATPADAGTSSYVTTSREVRLIEGDVVTVEVWQNSGAALALTVASGASTFAMHRVSV